MQWPEPVQQAIKWLDYMDWVRGQISAELPFFKTEEELQQEAARQAEGQQENLLNEGVAKAIPGVIQQSMQEG